MHKIDFHSHAVAFPEYSPKRKDGHKYLSAEELLKIFDDSGTDFGVLHPVIIPEAHWATMSNEGTQYIVHKYPDRFTWYCNVDPRQGTFSSNSDLGFIISQYKEMGAKGVGEIGTQLYADDPMMQNLFKSCVELDMPIMVHVGPWYGGTYGIIDEAGLPRIERMLKQFPDLKLIGHSAAFWCEITADTPEAERDTYPKGRIKKEGRLPFLLREYGNLYCDISANSGRNAFMRDPEYACKFLTEFADRLYYGSDVCKVPASKEEFPHNYLTFLEQLVKDGGLSQENYEKIMYKNAAKLLNMEERFM